MYNKLNAKNSETIDSLLEMVKFELEINEIECFKEKQNKNLIKTRFKHSLEIIDKIQNNFLKK